MYSNYDRTLIFQPLREVFSFDAALPLLYHVGRMGTVYGLILKCFYPAVKTSARSMTDHDFVFPSGVSLYRGAVIAND